MPVLLAGSAGGYLKTGRYIDYMDWNRPAEVPWDSPIREGVAYNR